MPPTGATRTHAGNSDEKRRTSALWFGRHHRGGDAILHHRTLTPIVLRDWAIKLELFTAALELTTNTNTKPPKPWAMFTTKELAAFNASEWTRPEPAPSTYLDTAAEPVTWPTRSEPRTPPGTRPRLPNEHRDYNCTLTNPLRPTRIADTETAN